MALKLALDITGLIVIDPTIPQDLQLLTLLSAKQILTRAGTYDPEKGYVGQHYEPGTVTISMHDEGTQVMPRGTHDRQWKAYEEARDARRAAEKAQEVDVSNAA